MPGSGERVFFQDLHGFLVDDRISKFMPDASMTFEEQLNAIMRFALYFGIAMVIVKRSFAPLFFPAAVGAVIWGVVTVRQQDAFAQYAALKDLDMMHTRAGKLCTRPTLHNPFMNVLTSDVVSKPLRPRACDVTRSDVQKQMEDEFGHNLYRDVDDAFDRRTSSRQFYTMPVTTIPGDQTAFANWLYLPTGKSCKEGSGRKCAAQLYRPLLI